MGVWGSVIVNGLASGAMYGLFGAGFGLIFFVTSRFHYAYGVYFALAGVLAGWGSEYHGWNVWLAGIVGVAVASVAGVLTEVIVYRPLDTRSRSVGLLGVFIASLFIVIAVEAAMQLWLDSAPTYGLSLIPPHFFEIGGVWIPEVDVVMFSVAWVLLFGLSLIFHRTAIGRKMRAVAANRSLADTFGLNVKRIFVITFALGSVTAAVLGILYTSQNSATSTMGTTVIVYAFVVAFLARQGGPLKWGSIGLILGVGTSTAGELVGAVWEQPIVFGALFAVVAALPYADRLRELRERVLGQGAMPPPLQLTPLPPVGGPHATIGR